MNSLKIFKSSLARRIKKQHLTISALAFITLIGLALRLYGIHTRGIWGDEALVWLKALTGSYWMHLGPLPPFVVFLLMWLTNRTDPIILHIPSILAGTMAIPVIYIITKRLRNQGTALTAAILLAINPLAITCSQEAKAYGFLQLFTALLLLTLLGALKTKKQSYWIMYGVVLSMCGMTHLLAVQLIAALFIFFLLRIIINKTTRADSLCELEKFVKISFVGSLIGFIWLTEGHPVTWVFKGHYSGGIWTFIRLSMINLGPICTMKSSFMIDSFGFITFMFALWGAIFLFKRQRDAAHLLMACLCIPAMITYATMRVVSSWDWHRFISHLTIPYLILVACGFEAIKKYKNKFVYWISWVVILAGFLTGLKIWAPNAVKIRNQKVYNWSRKIQMNMPRLGGVIFCSQMTHEDKYWVFLPFHVYRKDNLPTYFIEKNKIFMVNYVPGRAELARIPVFDDLPDNPLPQGKYVILSPQEKNNFNCQTLNKYSSFIKSAKRDFRISKQINLPVCRINEP